LDQSAEEVVLTAVVRGSMQGGRASQVFAGSSKGNVTGLTAMPVRNKIADAD
jgi:hypothetical protein